VARGNEILVHNIINPETLEAHTAGQDPALSKLGKTVERGLEGAGLQAGSMRWEMVHDKLCIVVPIDEASRRRIRARIEAVPFNLRATAAYNELTGALAWSDELPDGLSPAGHDYVRDLLGVRGYLHRAPAGRFAHAGTRRWRPASAGTASAG
jgi:hypothetical protein